MTDEEILELLQDIDNGYKPREAQVRELASRGSLTLNGANITSLPNSIGMLASVKSLSLRRAKIQKLPDSIGNLSALTTINLIGTDITFLPDSIGNIKSLKHLYLRDTRLYALPETIGNLELLESLYLRGVKTIERLPQSISKLTNLQGLWLEYTGITELPDTVRCLKNLKRLSLKGTQICHLPDWIGELTDLFFLDLSELRLDRIPESLAKSEMPFVDKSSFSYFDDRGINLYHTSLSEQQVTAFLGSKGLLPEMYQEQIKLQECKVIFLGDGSAGKSYTIQRILADGRKGSFRTTETPGIEIKDYSLKKEQETFTIHFWDFGGQQLLHSMHRCFLTEQTCYVVTVKTRETDSNNSARYWLRNITAFAPNSPILLFVNCWNDDNGLRSIDEPRLKKEFPQIRTVVYCSAKNARKPDFQKKLMYPLFNLIVESALGKMTINAHWNDLRLDIQKETQNYLTKERYHELCQLHGVENENASDLLSVFNNLGVCFSYHLDKERKELVDYKLLNPIWLTNAIYAIIEEGMAIAKNGSINRSAIEQMLSNKAPTRIHGKDVYRRTMPELTYKSFECQYIIDVAESHSLCYPVTPDTVFFPALCTTNSPDDSLKTPEGFPCHLSYRMNYQYLPDSIVHQLMITCIKRNFVVEYCWQKGLLISVANVHKAVILMNDDVNLSIDIFSIPGHPIWDLFQMLRQEILHINDSLSICACSEYVVDGDDAYPVMSLLGAVKGAGVVYSPTCGKEHNAVELLGGFYEDWTTQWMQVSGNSIVIPIVPRVFHKHNKNDQILRKAIYEAYHGICPYCNKAIGSIRQMEIDHILPKGYVAQDDLIGYIEYLERQGFNTKKPDYIENYFPVHKECNRDKLNDVDIFTLPFRHEFAAKHTKKILEIIEKNSRQNNDIK